MKVDVETQVEIHRPRPEVAAYAADPDNATAWYANIQSVNWATPKPLRIGSRIAFVARFLGRRISYTYEVTEYVDGERLVFSTADGPFAMETTYEWEDNGDRSTRMRLRNRGNPTGFANVAGAAMARAMRRANQKDLERLRRILESPAAANDEG